jgi:hypothetical protein
MLRCTILIQCTASQRVYLTFTSSVIFFSTRISPNIFSVVCAIIKVTPRIFLHRTQRRLVSCVFEKASCSPPWSTRIRQEIQRLAICGVGKGTAVCVSTAALAHQASSARTKLGHPKFRMNLPSRKI